MIKHFILLLWLCLVVIDACPDTASDIRDVLDLPSACARMDMWGSSEVAKALCGAANYYQNCAVGKLHVSNLQED